MKTGRELLDRVLEADLHVSHAIHLATAITDDGYRLAEWLAWDAEAAIDALDVGWIFDQYSGPHSRSELLAMTVVDRPMLGWLLVAETPIKQYIDADSEIVQKSWGHYTTKVFYADTYEEALDAAITWAESQEPRPAKAAT